jgi:hypothetical protein
MSKTYIVLKDKFSETEQERIVGYVEDCGVEILGRYVEIYRGKRGMLHIKGRAQHDVYMHELRDKELG